MNEDLLILQDMLTEMLSMVEKDQERFAAMIKTIAEGNTTVVSKVTEGQRDVAKLTAKGLATIAELLQKPPEVNVQVAAPNVNIERPKLVRFNWSDSKGDKVTGEFEVVE